MFLLLWACNRPPPMHPMIVPTDYQVDFEPWFTRNHEGIAVRAANGIPAGTTLYIADASIPLLSYNGDAPDHAPDPPAPDPAAGHRSPMVVTDKGLLPAEAVAQPTGLEQVGLGWLPPGLEIDLDADGEPDYLWTAQQSYLTWSENQEMWLGEERASWLIVSNEAGRVPIRVMSRGDDGGAEELEWIRATDLAGDSRPELAILVRTAVPEAGYGGRELRLYTQAGPGGGPLRELAAIHAGDPPGAGLTGPRLGWVAIRGGEAVRHDLWQEPGDPALWHRLTRYRREGGGLVEAQGAAERLSGSEAERLRPAFDAAVERGGYEDPWCRWVRIVPDQATAERVEVAAQGEGCGG